MIERIARLVTVGTGIVLMLAGAGATTRAASSQDIQPHRAYYELSLESLKQSSQVSGVSGALAFEWADACEGWSVEQQFEAVFSYAEGDQGRVSWRYVTWESKEGDRYTFNLEKQRGNTDTEEIRGTAEIAGDGTGSVAFRLPEDQTIALQDGTLFPTQHTIALIEAAQNGKPLLFAPIFDGSDVNAGSAVNAVIGKLRADEEADLPDSPLLDSKAWPIRLAYFDLDDQTGEPDHEQSLMVQPNGIVRSLILDYGDFQVKGTLRAIEALEKSGC